jgi:hypothetical protein
MALGDVYVCVCLCGGPFIVPPHLNSTPPVSPTAWGLAFQSWNQQLSLSATQHRLSLSTIYLPGSCSRSKGRWKPRLLNLYVFVLTTLLSCNLHTLKLDCYTIWSVLRDTYNFSNHHHDLIWYSIAPQNYFMLNSLYMNQKHDHCKIDWFNYIKLRPFGLKYTITEMKRWIRQSSSMQKIK